MRATVGRRSCDRHWRSYATGRQPVVLIGSTFILLADCRASMPTRLVVDELKRNGVEIVFLNHGVGTGPEDSLVLQVQGMVAEYERAKIQEHCRRGKLHAARKGKISALGDAP